MGTNNHRKQKMTAKKAMIICFMAFLFFSLCATTSFATFSMQFSEDGVYNGTSYNITRIEIFDLGGNRDFTSPGLNNFSAGTWTVNMPSINYVTAVNTTPGGTGSFEWTLWLTGAQRNAKLDLAYLVYTSTGDVYGTYINLNKGTWTFPTISPFDPNDPRFVTLRGGLAPVPVPPTVFLLGAGLIGVAVLRKRVHG